MVLASLARKPLKETIAVMIFYCVIVFQSIFFEYKSGSHFRALLISFIEFISRFSVQVTWSLPFITSFNHHHLQFLDYFLRVCA